MSIWIDFKELRARLKFEDVLTHFGVEIKRKGEQHMGFCPLPSHRGKRNSQSFSANLERGIFHCFGCQAKGNVLDFAVLMGGGSPEDGAALRKAALELQAKFCPDLGKAPAKRKVEPKPTQTDATQLELNTVVNPPLDFELQGLDRAHPYLLGRGFAAETIAFFGLGFCERGTLAGRVAIPLNDAQGKLVGYAGRVVDDATVTDENPRYRLPASREREGKALEFRKTLFLYNGFRFKTPVDSLVVVEGFPSVWWLTQNGFGKVVATIGPECSDEQADLIVNLVDPSGHIWIMPDGDEEGKKFVQSLLLKLTPHRFVRWAQLEKDCQPTDLSAHQLKGCLTM